MNIKSAAASYLPIALPSVLLVITALLSLSWPGSSTSGQAALWGLTLSTLGAYVLLYRPADAGRRLPDWLVCILRPLYRLLSWSANRPWIVARGSHLFFLSYGLLQALGAALFFLYFKLFFVGSSVRFPVDLMLLASCVPVIGGNRLAGLFVQVFVEGLSWRAALFRVRFLSIGFAAGVAVAIVAAAWWWDLPIAAMTDAAFTSLLWAVIFGNLGCIYYGCCHGAVCVDGGGVTYAHPSLKPNRSLGLPSVNVTPIPLYCAAFGAWILGFALVLRTQFDLPFGFLTAIVGTCFGLARYVEEWFRFDSKTAAKILVMNQFYAALLIALSVGVGLWGHRSGAAWKAQPLADVAASLADPSTYVIPAVIFVVVGFIYSYHRGAIGTWSAHPNDRRSPAGALAR